MSLIDTYNSLLGAKVAKVFPHFGNKRWKGKVAKVDPNDKDGKIFKVVYEDDDREWMSYEELQSILVEGEKGPSSGSVKKKRDRSSGRPSTTPNPVSTKKRSSSRGTTPPTDDTTDKNTAPDKHANKRHKKGKTPPPPPPAAADAEADAGKDVHESDDKDAAEAAAGGVGDAAGAAVDDATVPVAAGHGSGDGSTENTAIEPAAADMPLGTCEAAAAAADMPPGGSEAAEEPAGADTEATPASPALMEASDMGRLVQAAVTAATAPLAAAATPGSRPSDINGNAQTIQRMRFVGPCSAAMPDSSVYVCHSGVVRVTLVSRPTLKPGIKETDYAAEAQQLLGELETQLELAGSSKAGLLEVTIYLKDIVEGLPRFNDEWRKWASQKNLPVVTAVESKSAVPDAGITLKAHAVVLPM